MLIGAATFGSLQVSACSGQGHFIEHTRISSLSPVLVEAGTDNVRNMPNLLTWVVTVPCQYMIFLINTLIFL